ncbi:MAG: threonine aldolase family protein [Candidatus Dormibacteria bacterium]
MSPPSSDPAVDLRSDTFTTPDAEMRRVMAKAEVGDDVWGEDPSVRRLEEAVAEELGKAAAVFVPSGTMGNLTALASQTSRGGEVIVDRFCHVVLNEAGGAGAVAGVMLQTVDAPRGAPEPSQVRDAYREPNIHHPVSQLLWLENTHGGRAGTAVPQDRMWAAAAVAHELGLRVHCDGARIFNAAIALQQRATDLVAGCDTVSVCLSKGLGAPVGSVVCGDAPAIDEVRLWRKRLGGGMRQAGILAAAGLHALRHNRDRLADDHEHAALLAGGLGGSAGATVLKVEHPTNMVMLDTEASAAVVCAEAARQGVLVAPVGPHRLRAVTHRDVSREDVERAVVTLRRVISGLRSG